PSIRPRSACLGPGPAETGRASLAPPARGRAGAAADWTRRGADGVGRGADKSERDEKLAAEPAGPAAPEGVTDQAAADDTPAGGPNSVGRDGDAIVSGTGGAGAAAAAVRCSRARIRSAIASRLAGSMISTSSADGADAGSHGSSTTSASHTSPTGWLWPSARAPPPAETPWATHGSATSASQTGSASRGSAGRTSANSV